MDIVYGSKGAGKSALYALLLNKREDFFGRSILLTSAENPRGAPAFKSLAADTSLTEPQFVSLWKLYFLSLVCDMFEEYGFSGKRVTELRAVLEREGLIRRGRGLGGLLRAVADYVRSVKPGGVSASVNVNPMTGLPEVEVVGRGIVFREPSASEIERGLLSLDRLFEVAEEVLTEQDFCIWILLDRLDVAFAECPGLEKTALRALFRAYLDLLAFRHIAFKIFLRSDIWARITAEGFREARHITRDLTISWNRSALLNLVVSRAIQNETVQTHYHLTPREVMSSVDCTGSVFPPHVSTEGCGETKQP